MSSKDKHAVILIPSKLKPYYLHTYLYSNTREKLFTRILNSYYIHFSEGWKEYFITEIRHPRTRNGHLYAFNGDKTCLCEVVCVNDPHSAWFIGNTIGKFI